MKSAAPMRDAELDQPQNLSDERLWEIVRECLLKWQAYPLIPGSLRWSRNGITAATELYKRAARTLADHQCEWDAARLALDHGDVPRDLLLEAAKNLLDATAFKNLASLRIQAEIVRRIGASRG